MVCIDKATAVRMYDKVKRHWGEEIAVLQAQRIGARADALQGIDARLARMQETDMAVVVSQGQ
ncbi:MAG: hypothetical protein MUQ10_20385, partial [Anaerolineae bacterium]|nr:hypothetical protein [Anaerolineae bacterium]